MTTISINKTIKYELSCSPNYVWTDDNLCYNLKTGRQIRQTIVSGSIGYCINGKFKSLTSLRGMLRKPEKTTIPF